MRISFLFALLVLLLPGGCATPAEELLPIPASVRGASQVGAVEVTVRAAAAAAVAAGDDGAPLPFREMLAASIQSVAHEWGLTSGRPLKLIVEIDAIDMPRAAAAAFGRSDRLAGSVFVIDAASGEPLGQLYVDVVNTNAGLLGLALRGGSVREALAEEFAVHVARALSGRPRKP